MKFIISILKDFPSYLWGGFTYLASIFIFFAIWEVAHQFYEDLILSSVEDTFTNLYYAFINSNLNEDFIITLKRVFLGYTLSLFVGTFLGLLAGFYVTASVMSRPIVSIFMGMPPIVWIVLAMIWFGFGDKTIIFTVVVASFPIFFVGALQGMRTLEGDLYEMTKSFNFNFYLRFKELYVPHLFSYLFPSWVSALAMSWKIVVMAELLSSDNGLGAQLAIARSQLDTPYTLALVVLLVSSLMIVEYAILEPIRKEVEAWRG